MVSFLKRLPVNFGPGGFLWVVLSEIYPKDMLA